MRHLLLVSLLFVSAILLTGCSLGTTPTTAGDSTPNSVVEKRGDTVKSGKLLRRNAVFMIETAPGVTEAVDSVAIDLSAYENQQVTITGQYSGDTLFVGKIE